MKQTRNHYSQSFKQQVLDDFFQSGMSQHAFAEKHQIHVNTLNTWINACKNGSIYLHISQKKLYLCSRNETHM